MYLRTPTDPEWEDRLSQYDPQTVTESQFLADFCRHVDWGSKIENGLSEILRHIMAEHDGGYVTGLFRQGFINRLHETGVWTVDNITWQKLHKELPSTFQERIQKLLDSIELITFRKGEAGMLQYLAQHEKGYSKKHSMPSQQDFPITTTKNILDASGAWYSLSDKSYNDCVEYTQKRLREIIQQFAKISLSKSTLGERLLEAQNGTLMPSSTQYTSQNLARTFSSIRKDQKDEPLDSEVVVTDVIHNILQDLGLDLTCHSKTLNSEMRSEIWHVKCYYEGKVVALAKVGNLPDQTPCPAERDRILTDLTDQVEHIYSREKGKLGSHRAFVQKMLRRHFGSLLITGKHNSFDHWLGSAHELTDMIFNQIFLEGIEIYFPKNKSGHGILARDSRYDHCDYRNLRLTSRQMKACAHSHLLKRMKLLLDLNLSKSHIEKVVATALRTKSALRSFLPSDLGRENDFASIPYLRFYFNYNLRPRDNHRTNQRPILAFLNMLPNLRRVRLDVPHHYLWLAFSAHGRPAKWLVNIIASILGNPTFEIRIDLRTPDETPWTRTNPG